MNRAHPGEDGGIGALQVAFVRDIVRRDAAFDAALLDEVTPGGTLTAAEALGIHREGYVARLTEQLGETFATVWRVLGDEDFFALAARCIARVLSTSHNLSDYGRGFPSFLAESEEGRRWPFLVELARLELAFHEAFHAGPHEAVPAAELAAREDLATLGLRFGPSVRLLALGAKVLDLFLRRDDEETPVLDGIDEAQCLVVLHAASSVRVVPVGAGVLEVLGDLSRGVTVGEALDALAARRPAEAQATATGVFETLGSLGLVASVAGLEHDAWNQPHETTGAAASRLEETIHPPTRENGTAEPVARTRPSRVPPLAARCRPPSSRSRSARPRRSSARRRRPRPRR